MKNERITGLVKLIQIDSESQEIIVDGADLLDGTPILDIKPYIKTFDSCFDANEGWVEKAPFHHLQVSWPNKIPLVEEEPQLKEFINSCLKNDPRCLIDFKNADSQKIYKTEFASYHVEFLIENDVVKILNLKKL